jgi:hypothetical protein
MFTSMHSFPFLLFFMYFSCFSTMVSSDFDNVQ